MKKLPEIASTVIAIYKQFSVVIFNPGIAS